MNSERSGAADKVCELREQDPTEVKAVWEFFMEGKPLGISFEREVGFR